MRWLCIAAALCTLTAAPARAADPVEGVWQTQPDDGAYAHVRMAPCDAGLCGTIERSFNASGEYASANKGKRLVIDMVPQGDGKYAGRVWRPSNDRIYIGRMQLSGDRLTLRGCVAGGLICKTQTWARVK